MVIFYFGIRYNHPKPVGGMFVWGFLGCLVGFVWVLVLFCFVCAVVWFYFFFSQNLLLQKNNFDIKKNTLSVQNYASLPSYLPVLNENIWTPLYHKKIILFYFGLFSVQKLKIFISSKLYRNEENQQIQLLTFSTF